MNKEAVALAADSAVTFGDGDKIWPSANKIFALSKYEPIGIMIYGRAEFMGVPWETIVKIYRNKLGKKTFPTVIDYVVDVVEFLKSFEHEFLESEIKSHFHGLVYKYFASIRDEISEGIDRILQSNDDESLDSVDLLVTELISERIIEYHSLWNASDFVEGSGKRNINRTKRKYKSLIIETISEIFENIAFDDSSIDLLVDIGASIPFKDYDIINSSGIVIAGFGEQDIFPALQAIEVEGIVDNVFKYASTEYFQISAEMRSLIMPFAQSEMAMTFMTGIDPNYQAEVKKTMLGLIYEMGGIECDSEFDPDDDEAMSDEEVDEILTRKLTLLEQFQKENFSWPIIGVVSLLPKTELASMAEALVSLASLKQKVTLSAETVGGPIDVAIISKGDGFIWKQRKHYFDEETNQHFFGKYFMEGN